MARKRHTRRHSRRYRGGNVPYNSAASYQEYVNGTSVNDQVNRTFGDSVSNNGNLIIGAQGQNSTMTGTPSNDQLSLIQSAGKRGSRGRKRRGGFWASVVNDAIVPFGLLGLQQTYGKRRKGGKRTKRHSRRH